MTLALATALSLAACHIVDGDTLRCQAERIRLIGIDAPETEQAKCASERARGLAAKDRLRELLAPGFTVERDGVDRYGRTLATVRVNGRDVGAVMVAEGLARPYAGGRRPWC